jgi:hypothetical protein
MVESDLLITHSGLQFDMVTAVMLIVVTTSAILFPQRESAQISNELSNCKTIMGYYFGRTSVILFLDES